jgi:hypothetical protein
MDSSETAIASIGQTTKRAQSNPLSAAILPRARNSLDLYLISTRPNVV